MDISIVISSLSLSSHNHFRKFILNPFILPLYEILLLFGFFLSLSIVVASLVLFKIWVYFESKQKSFKTKSEIK